MSIFSNYKKRYSLQQAEEMSLEEYLDLCKKDPLTYATAAERMLIAIGKPEIIDTKNDERLSRIYMNRKIKVYPAFKDFFGMEEVVENIVSFFQHAAQGLEESKQILYLLGPVGGGKSSLSETIKHLMETVPFYVLKAFNKNTNKWELSPIYESPLGLFDPIEDCDVLENKYGINQRYFSIIMSPWANKRLEEAEGDLSKFKVVKLWPSILKQIGITKVEPGDENNQDISSLVGKVNISALDEYEQHDPDAYNWAGGMNITTQGLMEFVEMFKASSVKILHPMLTATQEHHYNGTEQFGAIPHHGIFLSHSNMSEWELFRNNKTNEAFIDRVYTVKVPYCLRITEEEMIYNKLISNSELNNAPCAPGTYNILSQFSVLTRLKQPENSSLFSKLEIYDGKNLKDKDAKARTLQDYRDDAGVDEGMTGSSTRFAFKILSKVFNYDSEEISANPIHLLYVLEKQIEQEQLDVDTEERWISFVKGVLAPKYAEFLGDEIQKAYLESYSEYGQNLFDRYIQYADFWIQDKDYRDSDTGEMFDRESLDEELKKIEQPLGAVDVQSFRNEVVNFVLRVRAANDGENPRWTSYEKLRTVIEKRIFKNTEEILPIISFSKKSSEEEEKKHEGFVSRMLEKGYTRKQIRLVVDWYMRYSKNN